MVVVSAGRNVIVDVLWLAQNAFYDLWMLVEYSPSLYKTGNLFVLLCDFTLSLWKFRRMKKKKYISIWEFTLHFLSRLLGVSYCINEIIATVSLIHLLIWKHVWCGSKLKKWHTCFRGVIHSLKMPSLFSLLNCYLMNLCWKLNVRIISWIN